MKGGGYYDWNLFGHSCKPVFFNLGNSKMCRCMAGWEILAAEVHNLQVAKLRNTDPKQINTRGLESGWRKDMHATAISPRF